MSPPSPLPPAPDRVVLGEESSTKLVAVYATPAAAERARDAAQRLGALAGLLTPAHARVRSRDLLARAFEPESRGIEHTLLRTHLLGGVVGLALGLAVWAVVRSMGVPMVTASPLLSAIFIGFLGLVFGLLAGGLVALRPDHTAVLVRLRTSLREGRHAVIVHLRKDEPAEPIEAALRPGSERIDRTL